LWRQNLAARLDLGPLESRALDEIVDHALDGVLDTVSRRELHRIACGEPLPLDLLDRLVGPDVAAAAERTGLMASEQSHRRVLTRLAHPLYAQIIRTRLTPARVRRIWDRIATAMADNPMRRRDDHLFAGLAHLRAQRRTDPDLLLTAARRAYARADLELAEALARATQEAGGGWQADQLRAEALDRNGRYQQAARVAAAAARR
jgi:hypothetical protein